MKLSKLQLGLAACSIALAVFADTATAQVKSKTPTKNLGQPVTVTLVRWPYT